MTENEEWVKQPLCECCNENESQVELKSLQDPTEKPYKVCYNCLQPLVCFQLHPSDYKNLLNNGHSDEEFLIHGDFYDSHGHMLQPECGIDFELAKSLIHKGY